MYFYVKMCYFLMIKMHLAAKLHPDSEESENLTPTNCKTMRTLFGVTITNFFHIVTYRSTVLQNLQLSKKNNI